MKIIKIAAGVPVNLEIVQLASSVKAEIDMMVEDLKYIYSDDYVVGILNSLKSQVDAARAEIVD